MAEALPLMAYTSLEERIEALYRDGYTYLPGILDAAQILILRTQMDALTALSESCDSCTDPAEHGFMNKAINNAFNRHEHFVQFLDYPGIIEIAEAVHGADCHCIGMTAWMTGPGRPTQTLHADWLPLSLPEDVLSDPRVHIPIYITTTHFYLDDQVVTLGPTNLVPGSHLSGRKPDSDKGEVTWRGEPEKSILCNAGDVVVFRSEVWHRGTANTSNRTRYLLQVHYGMRMITQKYPPYLNRFQFDPTILETATERQRRLMGDHQRSNYD